MRRANKKILSSKKHIALLIILTGIFITAAGYLYYKNEERFYKQQKYIELKAVADLKEKQIDEWVKKRDSEAKVLTYSPFFVRRLYDWLHSENNERLKAEIVEGLESFQTELGYKNIFIASSEGNILLSAEKGSESFDPVVIKKIKEASVKKEIVHTDLYISPSENKIYYDIISPLTVRDQKTYALLVFRIDPYAYLYPLIQTWPSASRSAETMLLRVEKDSSLLFLN